MPGFAETLGEWPAAQNRDVGQTEHIAAILEWIERQSMFLGQLSPRFVHLWLRRPLQEGECRAG